MKLFLLLSLLLVAAAALPFGPNSGVIEANSKNYNTLLKTHKPVFVMFYAPWCGHCKQMHPDYEKFAKNMKGMARVIAVNGDQHKELSSQFGIKGFPTIKYYAMGDKSKVKVQDYQGQRKANDLTKAAMNLVKNDFVTSIKKLSDLDAAITKSSSGKAAILVSNKASIPPMWAVVAGSTQLNTAKFVFASEKQTDIVKALDITSFPTIAVVHKNEEGQYTTSVFDGKIEYDPIAKFLLAEVKSEKDGAKGSDAADAEDNGAEKEEKKPKKEPSNPKPALPLKPTALSKYSLDFFCSNKALKIKGQSPLCVIAANEERDLVSVHAKYSNEPVLFFYATDASEIAAIGKSIGASVGDNDVLMLRSWKDKAKYVVMKEDDDLDAYLSRVLEGSVALKKADAFPTL